MSAETTEIPDEVMLAIISYFDLEALFVARRVCARWCGLVSDRSVGIKRVNLLKLIPRLVAQENLSFLNNVIATEPEFFPGVALDEAARQCKIATWNWLMTNGYEKRARKDHFKQFIKFAPPSEFAKIIVPDTFWREVFTNRRLLKNNRPVTRLTSNDEALLILRSPTPMDFLKMLDQWMSDAEFDSSRFILDAAKTGLVEVTKQALARAGRRGEPSANKLLVAATKSDSPDLVRFLDKTQNNNGSFRARLNASSNARVIAEAALKYGSLVVLDSNMHYTRHAADVSPIRRGSCHESVILWLIEHSHREIHNNPWVWDHITASSTSSSVFDEFLRALVTPDRKHKLSIINAAARYGCLKFIKRAYEICPEGFGPETFMIAVTNDQFHVAKWFERKGFILGWIPEIKIPHLSSAWSPKAGFFRRCTIRWLENYNAAHPM
jgi:F-box-like